jgi:DNA topoisomerase-3
VIWKKKASKTLPVAVAKELIASLAASRERGEDPGVGRTEKAVTGFRGRSGRTFRAKLKLEQTEEGKWRVDFDEEWAKEPPKGEAEEERAEEEAADSADSESAGVEAA